MELAIDTSTAIASIALAHEGESFAETTWRAGRNHTVECIPAMINLLMQCHVELHDMEAVVVARGPGSFNGLRVAMATAKGLAFSLGVPLVGISTLEAMAYPHAESEMCVCSIVNAGRNEIAAALFQTVSGVWTRIEAEHITTVDDVCAKIAQRTMFCGEIDSARERQIRQALGSAALIGAGASTLRRAGYLAELGWRRIASGDIDDMHSLQPLYLKKPAITHSKKERRHDAMSSVRSRSQ